MNRNLEVSDRSWAGSPCSSCRTSPCCTRLPLYRFQIETLSDFGWARRALEHPRIELGLYDSGWWMAYYLAPCRFLNPLDSKCMIHGSERQPQVCRDYSPVRCWYKRVFVDGRSPDFIRFDSRRFAALAEMVAFDTSSELSKTPSWEEMVAHFETIPLHAVPGDDFPIERYAPEQPRGLIVPVRTPRHRRDLSFVRFRLGFHGVRLGISADGWVAIIGDPPEAAGYRILSYEGIEAFLASISFDEAGNIVAFGPDAGSPTIEPSPAAE